MVAIGRGLVSAPRLLLLDEPSLGLAPIIVKTVFEALREVSRRTPILLVEQNAVTAIDLCQRGYVLVDGRIVMQGTSQELGSREALIDSYLGQATLAEAER
jgi:branched-chain amino acid transport system ATP-binding protein